MSHEEREAYKLALEWLNADPTIEDKVITPRERNLMLLAIRCMWNPGLVRLRLDHGMKPPEVVPVLVCQEHGNTYPCRWCT